MTVKSTRYGIIHQQAHCTDPYCEWLAAWGEQGVSQRHIRECAMRHVAKTGHAVVIETGSSTTYWLEEEKK